MPNPRKPTALKILQGNPGKRALNRNEPQPERGVPRPPAWLEPVAKREWKRIGPELERLNLLTHVDMASLAGYCQAYARWKQAEQVISRLGFSVTLETKGGGLYEQQRPEVSISHKQQVLMRAFASDFGLSPSSRGRLTMPEPKSADPFEAFLTGKAQ